MNKELVWLDEYNIGVESIDKEHQRLFKIINRLFAFSDEEKKNQRTCQEGVKFFKGHAVKHFADEEAYMESIQYGGLEQHRKLHDGFRGNTLPALEQELEKTGYAPDAVDHFLGVCTGWLIAHTLTEDAAIVGRGISQWDKQLPKDEMEAMKKAVVQLTFDLFQLESHVISDSYGGEKFGKGVYYRLAYRAPQGEEQQEVFLAFEEKLLLNTVGKVMGLKSNKLDSMLVHAARYMARQFVQRIREHFPAMAAYALKEESLLTYEQFQAALERKKPQVSLLLNTGGAGYFAYCVVAPHLLEDSSGAVPLGKSNALTEVEKYLSRREAQQQEEESVPKRKILIVDDSTTVRQGMKNLLEGDYSVSLVDSGAAAFRAISLDPPDLVLLDYEMPICDGKQTLEMLRSVEAFKDTPVIFLTGRRDPESMIKVMPLNPSGYLLKYLKPEEIKKKIDAFFVK